MLYHGLTYNDLWVNHIYFYRGCVLIFYLAYNLCLKDLFPIAMHAILPCLDSSRSEPWRFVSCLHELKPQAMSRSVHLPDLYSRSHGRFSCPIPLAKNPAAMLRGLMLDWLWLISPCILSNSLLHIDLILLKAVCWWW